ncbi:unnamed protein product, partial [Rodentolepis nana]|uniref:PDCD2_C domain-containing protein n=1 Tax=Rodentolepis nana TaxID=102285 RepID=A0A0R3TJ95_RODNA
MHRIELWQPTPTGSPEQKSMFYYCEVLCDRRHFEEIGLKYLDNFKGSLPFDLQVDPEIRQRSRLFEWKPYCEVTDSCESTCSNSQSEYQITGQPTTPRSLTADFCPWSKEDGIGADYLFDRLFSIEQRIEKDFASFSENYSEGNISSSNALVGLINTENVYERVSEVANCVKESNDDECEITSVSTGYDNEDQGEGDLFFLLFECGPSMKQCNYCNGWPIRFAPQQSVELSTTHIQVPPWRASAGRLLHDVCNYCTRNPHLENLVLLDPMVSQWSYSKQTHCNNAFITVFEFLVTISTVPTAKSDEAECEQKRTNDWS